MDTQTKIMDTLHEKAADLKSKLEELKMRSSIGRNEAADTYEREWRNFSSFLEEQGGRLRRMGYFSTHLLDELESRLPELQAALAEPIPTKAAQFYSWRERTARHIYEIEFIIKELFPTLDEEGRELISRLRLKLDLFRAPLMMAKASGPHDFADEASAVRTVCEETMAWRERRHDALRNRLDEFGDGVRDLFSKMKGVVGEVFKK